MELLVSGDRKIDAGSTQAPARSPTTTTSFHSRLPQDGRWERVTLKRGSVANHRPAVRNEDNKDVWCWRRHRVRIGPPGLSGLILMTF